MLLRAYSYTLSFFKRLTNDFLLLAPFVSDDFLRPCGLAVFSFLLVIVVFRVETVSPNQAHFTYQ
jgi:hypothetical protein